MSINVLPLRRPRFARATGLRLKPAQGEPRCVCEQIAQWVWRNKLAVYTAAVVTIVLVVQVTVGTR